MPFDGDTYDPARDHDRLLTLVDRVVHVMRDGAWHTLAELAQRCHGSEAACSARVRDQRKDKFQAIYGICLIHAERIPEVRGLWRYRREDVRLVGRQLRIAGA